MASLVARVVVRQRGLGFRDYCIAVKGFGFFLVRGIGLRMKNLELSVVGYIFLGPIAFQVAHIVMPSWVIYRGHCVEGTGFRVSSSGLGCMM
jgi:hypothetical protein